MPFNRHSTRGQWPIQSAGFWAKKHQRANRREAGEMPGATIIGDQQIAVKKQTGQGLQIFGVADKVQAQRMRAFGLDSKRQRLVF